jgi:hypothetical protein
VKEKRGEVLSKISYLAESEVERMVDKRVTKLRFYLADVESFHQRPCVVVPDIDERPFNRYIVLKERPVWKEDFSKWLARDYEKFLAGLCWITRTLQGYLSLFDVLFQ